jgi:hypothetical protein
MYATIGSLTPIDMGMATLMPAPGIRDMDGMPAPTSDAGLREGPLLVTWTYRGHLLYLENGASLYRDRSQSYSGNGFLSNPTEPESCVVNWRGEKFRAIVEFNSNVEPQAPQA